MNMKQAAAHPKPERWLCCWHPFGPCAGLPRCCKCWKKYPWEGQDKATQIRGYTGKNP